MKVTIDRDGCIECGLCAATCPDIFRMNDDDGKAEVYHQPEGKDEEDCASEAADGCPVSVIHTD
ncbi:MAG: ferredoxin [Christensenellales bacterium]|jgi:ferredoxin